LFGRYFASAGLTFADHIRCSELSNILGVDPRTATTLWRIGMKTIQEVFEHTLEDIYWAESALAKALPKVIKAVSNKDLSAALTDHLAETKGHAKTLEKVFKSIGKEAKGVKCDAMDGLLKECDGLLEEASGAALDAAVIGAAQAVEHYEIARYGTLREWAKGLGHDEAHNLLSSILDEEKAANSKLTSLAVSAVNTPAGRSK
jgi:ferritin-like metal-binding protein YciE